MIKILTRGLDVNESGNIFIGDAKFQNRAMFVAAHGLMSSQFRASFPHHLLKE